MKSNTSLQSILGSHDKSELAPAVSSARWRDRLARLIPWVLVGGFAGLAALLFGDRLIPATPVRLESIVTVRRSAETAAISGPAETTIADPWEAPALFQASGWVEPDPLPIKATALASGVVDTVSVLEGESVEKGQLLATLIQEDFELDLATAKSDLAALEAELKAHDASIATARARIDTLDKQVEAGYQKCVELTDRKDRLESVQGGAVSEEEVVQAGLRLETHRAEVEAMEASGAELESEVGRLVAMREDFVARIERARVEVDRRQLALERTEVKSPVDGIVLRLLAVPGQKRMLAMDDPDSATVAILYQPDRLQARIDVPLEEAAQLAVGQAVRLRSNFLPDTVFKGTVTRIVGEADLQRNTLQAKVRIENPDPRLRPDMLGRAEFLAAARETALPGVASGGAERVELYVPEAALLERNGSAAAVWTLDPTGERLERREIELGRETRGDHVRVHSGIRPGERVVVDPTPDLEEGERVSNQATTVNQ